MKKIVITKNNFKVMEIVEANTDKEKCEFKIVPMIENNKFKIYYQKMFSVKKEFEFDHTKYIEIIYHKAMLGLNTKIQLKIFNKEDKSLVCHEQLPLERLMDPDVKTEIPIPLLKIIFPDEILSIPYTQRSKYVRFEMGNNNIYELFMTKKDFIYSNFFDKYNTIAMTMMDDSFELFTSGIATGYNANCTFYESHISKEPKQMMVGSNITDDIGLVCISIFDPRIKFHEMKLLFIENEFYLNMVANRIAVFGDGPKKLIYEFDSEKLHGEEKEKFLYNVQKNIKKYQKYAKSHYLEYAKICDYYEKHENIEIEFE